MAMNERNDSAVDSEAKKPTPVSFADAARFLGVDTFTFYSLVQREEIPSVLAPSGEFVVSQDDLDRFAAKE
jgi:hypothetical protein